MARNSYPGKQFTEQVEIGDTIRSYDFKPMVGRDDCFVEGKVTAIDSRYYDAFVITVTKDSWDDARVGKEILVPIHVAYNDYPGRVMNLSRI
jgi:hypothetical protein